MQFKRDVIPVPRHWDPVFHIISSKTFFYASLQANFPGSQCQALG
ncbi:hypothetical protein [Wolbachia endosymbiont (group A) of Ennomos erosarius]